ncbi:MAG: transcription termination factor NusA [Phycisphaerae bacterium]
MNTDLLRFVDSISRDKKIDKESVYADLEAAMLSALRKAYDEASEFFVEIDRMNGSVTATVDTEPIDMKTLGRIAAQTAKQVMMQKIREDERNSIFEEYSTRVGTIVTGTITRFESGGLVVGLGRTEAFLPRSEQIPGEVHQPGERIRAMILDVREQYNQVRIVLTQTHPDYIRKLFELEVPEVGERIIEVRALAREAGYRTKIAVSSIDSKVDAVGACVGVRGSRIRNIVDELGGEKIDIVRWNESSQVLISNSLKPADVKETFLCFELGRATVIVSEDQLSLAIGKRGQNVRLAARLTGWDIDILTPEEYNKSVDNMERVLKEIDGVQDVMLDKLLAIGVISLADLAEVGAEPLVGEIGLDEAAATHMVEVAAEAAKRLAAEAEAAKAAAQAEAAKQAADASGETPADGVAADAGAVSGPTEASGADEQSDPAGADAGSGLAAQSNLDAGDAGPRADADDTVGVDAPSGPADGSGGGAEPEPARSAVAEDGVEQAATADGGETGGGGASEVASDAGSGEVDAAGRDAAGDTPGDGTDVSARSDGGDGSNTEEASSGGPIRGAVEARKSDGVAVEAAKPQEPKEPDA